MDNDQSESEVFRQVILAKKEKFRTENRKSKNKEEFAMKRVKLMQEKDKQGETTTCSQQVSQSCKENHQNYYSQINNLKSQRNEKESFFDQFNNQDQLQNGDINNKYHSDQTLYQVQQQLQNEENQIYESIFLSLQEFKNQYQNGNRKMLIDILCQIRKELIIASSQGEYMTEQAKKQQQMINNENEPNRHPVYQAILSDEQFLKIIQDILMINDYSQLREIQIECMWILINLCAGKNKECLIILNLGILDTFKHMLEHCNDFELLEHVCWCLGNLAADDTESREKLFEDSSLIETVVSRFYEKITTSMANMLELQEQNSNSQQQGQERQQSFNQLQIQKSQQNSDQNSLQYNQSNGRFKIVQELVFFLTNLIKKHPMPNINPLRKILQILKDLFFLDLPQVKVEIVKSFWVLLMKSDYYLQEVLQIDILRHIMPFLTGQNIQLIKISLDLFIQIVSKCDNFTMRIFAESKFQVYLEKAMCNHSREIKLKGIQLIQKILEFSQGLNIAAEIIYQERLIIKLLSMLAQEEFQIKTSIITLLKIFLESDMGVQKLIKLDYIQMLIRIGACNCIQIQKLVINSFDLIFEYGQSIHDYETPSTYNTHENQVLKIFFENQGEALLEQLQQSKSYEVYQLSNQLIKNFLHD